MRRPRYGQRMTHDLPTLALIALVGGILIGGPWWLISNAVERRRVKKVGLERIANMQANGSQLRLEIGLLYDRELEGIYAALTDAIATFGFAPKEALMAAVHDARLRTMLEEETPRRSSKKPKNLPKRQRPANT